MSEPPRPPDAIFGLVLAGGASRRMGADKALAVLAGRPLLAHAVARLAPQVGRVAIARDPALPMPTETATLPRLADPFPGREGPLAGILAGLEWAAAAGAARLQVVPVDAPFLPADLVARLAAAAPAEVPVIARSGDRLHPVVALLPVALAARLRDHLATGTDRAVLGWIRRTDPAIVDLAPVAICGEAVDPCRNLNTPADLAAAEAMLAGAAMRNSPATHQ